MYIKKDIHKFETLCRKTNFYKAVIDQGASGHISLKQIAFEVLPEKKKKKQRASGRGRVEGPRGLNKGLRGSQKWGRSPSTNELRGLRLENFPNAEQFLRDVTRNKQKSARGKIYACLKNETRIIILC